MHGRLSSWLIARLQLRRLVRNFCPRNYMILSKLGDQRYEGFRESQSTDLAAVVQFPANHFMQKLASFRLEFRWVAKAHTEPHV